jgi:hypothetical protein
LFEALLEMPAQSIPPIVLITAGVAGMGALQYGVHWIFKPNKARTNNTLTPTRVHVHRTRFPTISGGLMGRMA